MPVALATRAEDLTASMRQPDDFDGIIIKAPCFPMDYGKVWKEGANIPVSKYPFKLGIALHMKPDDADAFIHPIGATFNGGLKWVISATDDVDPKSNTSDIEWPGSPVAPNGLNMARMHDELQAIWKAVKGDIGLYHLACVERWGGSHTFNIGRETFGLPENTNWSFFLDNAQKLSSFEEALHKRWSDGRAPNPDAMLTGVRGHFLQLEMPERDGGRRSAMDEDKARKPFKVLCMTRFDGYVDVESAAPTTSSTTASAAPTTNGSTEELFRTAIMDELEERQNDDESAVMTGKDIKKIYFDKKRWTDEQRHEILAFKRKNLFLKSCGEWDSSKGELS